MTRAKAAWGFGLALLASAAVAEAHPYKLDIHPAVCEQKRGNGMIDYTSGTYVQVGANLPTTVIWIDVVCPITLPTMRDDLAAGGMSTITRRIAFQAVYEAKAASSANGALFCGLMYQWADRDSTRGWLTPNYSSTVSTFTPGGAGTLGKGILNSDFVDVAFPTAIRGQLPMQMGFHCYMSDLSLLRAIQVIME